MESINNAVTKDGTENFCLKTIHEAIKNRRDFYFMYRGDVAQIHFSIEENVSRIDTFRFYSCSELHGFNISQIGKKIIRGYTFIAGEKIILSIPIVKMKFLKYADDFETKLNIRYGSEKI